MSDVTFVKGMNVECIKFTNGGMIFKLGINMNRFYEENPTNDRGYLNIDIKESRSNPGNWYPVLNTYKPKPKPEKIETEENIVSFDDIDEDEIPF